MIYHVDVDPDDTDFFSVYEGHKGGESAEVAGKIPSKNLANSIAAVLNAATEDSGPISARHTVQQIA